MVDAHTLNCASYLLWYPGDVKLWSPYPICTSNVSVVAVNGNIFRVGAPYCETYDATRFGARACVFESCKGCVTACFGACEFALIRLMVQVSDITHRTIIFVLLMCPLYG